MWILGSISMCVLKKRAVVKWPSRVVVPINAPTLFSHLERQEICSPTLEDMEEGRVGPHH